ncbi:MULTISPECIES: GntR family transcriptional regulator [Micromonospora]|uniref:GntR family transcriptional regulator n=1 Tax=Micromonospora TaxID=1873 RepID=UPI00098D372D|nr:MULTISPECIES: GntR family transcriptional regulator [unclassified Micromonospora]MDI5937495.1 GntR family transcriptional regulator [Micromonospora sp. DH15]
MAMVESGWLSARYETVFEHIADGIASGRLTPGTRLAGERKLADDLGVSRETVRQGLQMAEQAGLIVRIATRGTFVAPPRVDQDLGVMDAFDSTVRHLQLKPAYRLLDVTKVRATREQAHLLDVGHNDELLSVQVLGLGSGLPLAYYESVLPERVAAQLPPKPPWGAKATYQVAAAAMGATALSVSQEFDAVAIPHALSQNLQVSPKSPGFKTVSLFTVEDSPIELRTAWYPGSRYRFRVSRQIRIAD